MLVTLLWKYLLLSCYHHLTGDKKRLMNSDWTVKARRNPKRRIMPWQWHLQIMLMTSSVVITIVEFHSFSASIKLHSANRPQWIDLIKSFLHIGFITLQVHSTSIMIKSPYQTMKFHKCYHTNVGKKLELCGRLRKLLSV